MKNKATIIFEAGGADFHPSQAQARLMAAWFEPFAETRILLGPGALDHLDGADLLILGGSHASRIDPAYLAPSPKQKQALVRWRQQGKPLLIHHGFAGSWHEDWPELLNISGAEWLHGKTWHPDKGVFKVLSQPDHPLTRDLPAEFSTDDEIYMDLVHPQKFNAEALVWTQYEGRRIDLAWASLQGPGDFPEAPWAYVALGHDETSIDIAPVRQLWTNLVRWALKL